MFTNLWNIFHISSQQRGLKNQQQHQYITWRHTLVWSYFPVPFHHLYMYHLHKLADRVGQACNNEVLCWSLDKLGLIREKIYIYKCQWYGSAMRSFGKAGVKVMETINYQSLENPNLKADKISLQFKL